ncbi:MAG: MarR family winged helix-turn-helix transcriptional regulator [Chloroflexales bacterium]|nr:MarR family winged helix-turn-helix transcriptional regulator [Chloroflexales bacterium]
MVETVETIERAERIAAIDQIIRQLTWQTQKQSLHTLSRPDIGLTLPQMVTMFAIRQVGRCRMSDLADITLQSAGTLTGIVDRLIEDGLVGRVRDVDDRRVVQVELTPFGIKRLEQVEEARCVDMANVLSGLNLVQLGQIEESLQLFLAGVNDMLEQATARFSPCEHTEQHHPLASIPSSHS